MRGRFKAPVMLNPDFRDILSAFNAERVEYLLVGAYAVAAHGLPRATGDIDLWIRPSTANAKFGPATEWEVSSGFCGLSGLR
jgi:hypothetical protein